LEAPQYSSSFTALAFHFYCKNLGLFSSLVYRSLNGWAKASSTVENFHSFKTHCVKFSLPTAFVVLQNVPMFSIYSKR